MNLLRLADFTNKYKGQVACIVGRGPTLFNYEDLADVPGPVIFINDSVAMENCLKPGQTSFFFALDRPMKVWLPRIQSVAVLPVDHVATRILSNSDDKVLDIAGNVILWTTKGVKPIRILQAKRSEIARTGQLYIGRGTIHSALHFAWFIGCSIINFIGCDGINEMRKLKTLGNAVTGYDTRLPNLSSTKPWMVYTTIRKKQEEICSILGLEARYIGTPAL